MIRSRFYRELADEKSDCVVNGEENRMEVENWKRIVTCFSFQVFVATLETNAAEDFDTCYKYNRPYTLNYVWLEYKSRYHGRQNDRSRLYKSKIDFKFAWKWLSITRVVIEVVYNTYTYILCISYREKKLRSQITSTFSSSAWSLRGGLSSTLTRRSVSVSNLSYLYP